jgi:hypothetical protein
VVEQPSEPATVAARAAWQIVLGVRAAVDVQSAVEIACPRSEFDEPAGLSMEHAELDQPVALRRDLAGERAAIAAA